LSVELFFKNFFLFLSIKLPIIVNEAPPKMSIPSFPSMNELPLTVNMDAALAVIPELQFENVLLKIVNWDWDVSTIPVRYILPLN
jgi:hypothetical protein